MRMVSKQWQTYVPPALASCGEAVAGSQFTKGRFIGEMYARVLLDASGEPARAKLCCAAWFVRLVSYRLRAR